MPIPDTSADTEIGPGTRRRRRRPGLVDVGANFIRRLGRNARERRNAREG
jgi:hypothetical protein